MTYIKEGIDIHQALFLRYRRDLNMIMDVPSISVVPNRRVVLSLSLPLAALLIACSSTGLLHPELYESETASWLAQTIGQDMIDLFLITPTLLFATLYYQSTNRFSRALWIGTNVYIVYTFLIYCFAVPFNYLFVFYCLILGLSFFSSAWWVMGQAQWRTTIHLNHHRSIPVIGYYFIVLSVVFYILWLSEIVPAAISGKTPPSLINSGLMTNPVHVLDLSIFLPSIFVTGMLALRRNKLAITWVPLYMVFFTLMDITIAALSITMQPATGIKLVLPIAMTVLAVSNVALLVWHLNGTAETPFGVRRL